MHLQQLLLLHLLAPVTCSSGAQRGTVARRVPPTRRVPHTLGVPRGAVAVPSAAQLAWMELEVGANICYGIGIPNGPWSPANCSCYGNLTAPPGVCRAMPPPTLPRPPLPGRGCNFSSQCARL